MAKDKLPVGWELKKLSDIAEVFSGSSAPQGSKYFEDGKYPFVRVQDLSRLRRTGNLIEVGDWINELAITDCRMVLARKGTILFPKSGAAILTNNRAVLGTDAYIVSHLAAVDVERELASAKWVYHWLCQVDMADYIENKAYPSLRISRIRDMVVPVPPLEEQKRIVARIEELLGRIEKAKSLRIESIEESSAIISSAIHKVFSREREEGWKTVNVDEIAEKVVDGPHKTPTYEEDGIPFVTVRNIVNRHLEFVNLKYISPEDHEEFCRRGKAEKGDILYTKDGTLGIPCLVETDKEFSFFVSVALIKPKHNYVLGEYLTYALDAPSIHEIVERRATGAALKHIVLREIKALEIPLPSISEQRCIVAHLDGLKEKTNQLNNLQSEAKKELDQLAQSVLAEAFKGEL